MQTICRILAKSPWNVKLAGRKRKLWWMVSAIDAFSSNGSPKRRLNSGGKR